MVRQGCSSEPQFALSSPSTETCTADDDPDAHAVAGTTRATATAGTTIRHRTRTVPCRSPPRSWRGVWKQDIRDIGGSFRSDAHRSAKPWQRRPRAVERLPSVPVTPGVGQPPGPWTGRSATRGGEHCACSYAECARDPRQTATLVGPGGCLRRTSAAGALVALDVDQLAEGVPDLHEVRG